MFTILLINFTDIRQNTRLYWPRQMWYFQLMWHAVQHKLKRWILYICKWQCVQNLAILLWDWIYFEMPYNFAEPQGKQVYSSTCGMTEQFIPLSNLVCSIYFWKGQSKYFGFTQMMVSSKSGAGIRSLRTVLSKVARLVKL